MPRVLFLSDFDWRDPRTPTVIVAYKKGMSLLVTTACATAALDKGCAVRSRDRNASSDDGR